MQHNHRPRHRTAKRCLSIQALETRRLLAANQLEALDQVSGTIQISAMIASNEVAANLAPLSFAAASATDNFASLGNLNGSRQVVGALNRFNLIDSFQFNVVRNAESRFQLSGLSRDANLYLFDADGNLLRSSARPGRANELITATLPAGTYFLAIVAATQSPTRYRLSLSAKLIPEPIRPPAPPAPPAPTTPSMPAPPIVPTTPTTGDNSTVQPLADVPYFGGSREWNLNAVGAPEAWAAGYTGRGVTVAVIDTGVDMDHAGLVQNLFVNPGEIPGNGIDDDGNGFVDDVHGFDFVDGDANPDDLNGHGTHVAGIITGVAPEAKILPVRVLDRNGSGTDAGVAAGIRYAARLGAGIINLSLGGVYSSTIESAIRYAKSLGSLIIAAAGNESSSVPGYPARFSASHDNVISVGAYGSSNTLGSFSNLVGASRSVQVDAPGVGIYSTFIGGSFATLSGTSMAAPHVAGLAALTLSANPNLISRELRDLLATGTVGRASRSDSIGQANATTTVAYAAAGLKTAPVSSNVTAATTRTTTQTASSFRVREAVGELFVGDELARDKEEAERSYQPVDLDSIAVKKSNGQSGLDDTMSADELDRFFTNYPFS